MQGEKRGIIKMGDSRRGDVCCPFKRASEQGKQAGNRHASEQSGEQACAHLIQNGESRELICETNQKRKNRDSESTESRGADDFAALADRSAAEDADH